MKLQRGKKNLGTFSVRGVERYQDLEIKLTGFRYITVYLRYFNLCLKFVQKKNIFKKFDFSRW